MAAKSEKSNDKPNLEIMELKELYELMVVKGLDVVDLKDDEGRIHLSRQPTVPAYFGHAARPASARGAAPAAAAAAPAQQETIKAPLAGVFYRSGSPDRPPFTQEGETVDVGQTLCIIEAMKVMNEIKAEKTCRIAKIAAENSRPVTVGQALFWIEPA